MNGADGLTINLTGKNLVGGSGDQPEVGGDVSDRHSRQPRDHERNGILSVGNLDGLTLASDANGVIVLSGAASNLQYQTALDSITFSEAAGVDPTHGGGDAVRSVTWSINSGTQSSSSGTSTLDTVHTLSLTGAATATFTQNQTSAVLLDSGLQVHDLDMITSATVAVSGFQNGDILNVGNLDGLTIASNANGILVLTGTASAAVYQTALELVSFSEAANGDPTHGGSDVARTVTWSITDANTTPNHMASITTKLDAVGTNAFIEDSLLGNGLPPNGDGFGSQKFAALVTNVRAAVLGEDAADGSGNGSGDESDNGSADGGSGGRRGNGAGDGGAGGGRHGIFPRVYVVDRNFEVSMDSEYAFEVDVPIQGLRAPLGAEGIFIAAKLADGSPLPSWIHFDKETGKLTGRLPQNIVSIALASNDNGSPGEAWAKDSGKLAVDVVGHNAKGQIAIMTVMVDLSAEASRSFQRAEGHSAPDTHSQNDVNPGAPKPLDHETRNDGEAGAAKALGAKPLGDQTRSDGRGGTSVDPERHSFLFDPNRQGDWLSEEPSDSNRVASAHGSFSFASTSTDFGAPAGRVGLSDQLRGLGWRGAAGERTQLLNSLRFGAGFNWW